MIDNSSEAKPFHIWEGVYYSFNAATAESFGLGFSGEIYSKRSLLAAQECLAALAQKSRFRSFISKDALLCHPRWQ